MIARMLVRDLFGQTLREAPSEAQIPSHKLLLRGAFVRQIAAGIYAWLPLGLRVLRKAEAIVRDEMNRAGGHEIITPILQPVEAWRRSGRLALYGDGLYRLTDRSDREFCLGPTHEELTTMLASAELPSYRDLPKIVYQINWKFRDEVRPRGGLLRGREFLMKDAYSFDASPDELATAYDRIAAAYDRIFSRCGLPALRIEADPGAMGGAGRNEEFVAPAAAGEDTFVTCASCGYAANTEAAVSRVESHDFGDVAPEPRKVHTPGQVTVDDVARFLAVAPRRLAKALLFQTAGGVVCALIPGDRELNEYKLAKVARDATMLTDLTHFVKGFAGPVGLRGARLIADESLRDARGLVTGANEADHHLTDVVVDRDFTPDEWADLIVAREGDGCARCDGTLTTDSGIEVAHIFELGTRYSDAFDATFAGESGVRQPYVMGCYGLGVSRVVAALVEAHNDERGIMWPRAVAPFDVALLCLSNDPVAVAGARDLNESLASAGVGVIVDERPVSAGIKFADADLIGYPLQVVAGKSFVATGRLEAKIRATGERFELEPNASAVQDALARCP